VTKQTTAWNQAQTIFQVGDLTIINGIFKKDILSTRQAFPGFDPQHILFTEINAVMSNSGITGDSIISKLKLTAKERSGLEIKNFTGDLMMTPKGMAFSNMDLATNKSHLRDYFSISYDDMRDFGNFIHKIKMNAVFDDSYVDSDDIAFFAPALKSWNKKISLRGNVKGTIDALAGRGMLIQAGNSTLLNGDISFDRFARYQPDIY
jgi:hypothetical protein